MKKKDHKTTYGRKLMSDRRFRYGLLALILGPVLAFASINVDVTTVNEAGTYEWSEDGMGKVVILPRVLDSLTNELELYFESESTASITIVIEDISMNETQRFDVYSHEGPYHFKLETNSRYMIIPHGTEYHGSVLEYDYTLEFYHQPYALLSLPAMASTVIGIYLIYSAQAIGLTVHFREESEDTGPQEKDYTPPSVFDAGREVEDEN